MSNFAQKVDPCLVKRVQQMAVMEVTGQMNLAGGLQSVSSECLAIAFTKFKGQARFVLKDFIMKDPRKVQIISFIFNRVSRDTIYGELSRRNVWLKELIEMIEVVNHPELNYLHTNFLKHFKHRKMFLRLRNK